MSKRDKLLRYLKTGKSLTKLQSIKLFGLINLGDVIHILRNKGYQIKTTFKKNRHGCRYAEYSLGE